MKRCFRLCIFILLPAFSGCRKDVPNFVAGQVRDAVSGSPVAAATITLEQYNPQSSSCFTSSVVQCALTGSDGKFSFTTQPGYSYRLLAQAPGYWSNFSAPVDLDYVDKPYNVNVRLQPVAWLRLHLKNAHPYDANDELLVCNMDLMLNGQQVDTTVFYGYAYGNTNNKIFLHLKRNNIQSDSTVIFYCPAQDTSVCTINY